jgi:acyl-CoA dehydrogenase
MDDHIYPNEAEYHEQLEELGHDGRPAILEKLKAAARERGLWNLFLPHLAPDAPGTKLSNLDYAPISEELGKVGFASEALNCAAPDTGNMEILNMYGSETVKRDWLAPLLEGEIRSAFSMTEPAVASSDATNIGLRIERDGDEYVLNGTKWFSSGGMRDRCKVLIVMGKTDPKASRHLQQSMIVVPRDTPGVTIGRTPHVFGYDHAGGHPEVVYKDVRVPVDNLLGEEAEVSPSRRPAWGLDASTTACAPSAWPSERWVTWSTAHCSAARSAHWWRRRASSRTGSPSHASRSTWRASTCCARRT